MTARMLTCNRLVGAEMLPNGHMEIFCTNDAAFRDDAGDPICEDCAAAEIAAGGTVTPVEPSYWTDLIRAVVKIFIDESRDTVKRFEERLAWAVKLEKERDELIRAKSEAESRAFRAESEVKRLAPLAAEIEQFRSRLPSTAPVGIGGIVPDGQRLEIE